MLFHLPTLQLVLNYIKQISKNTRALYPGSILPFLLNMQIMFKWGSVYLLNLHHHINRSLLFGFWQTQHWFDLKRKDIINSMNLWGVYSFMFNFMFKEWNLQNRNVCGFFFNSPIISWCHNLFCFGGPDAQIRNDWVSLSIYLQLCIQMYECVRFSCEEGVQM